METGSRIGNRIGSLWEIYPEVEEVKIPFQYNDRDYSVIHIEEVEAENITTFLNPDLVDSDDGNDHKLRASGGDMSPRFNEPTLVEVQEQPTASLNYAVRFIDLCKANDGTLKGYVQVLVSLGNANTIEKHGYTVLRITRTVASNRLTIGTKF